MTGDLLLVNGRVLTMNKTQPRANAIAIRNGLIAAVGAESDVRAAAHPKSEIIDLKGRTATPGLNDAHAHPKGVGYAASNLDLTTPPNHSIRDLVELVAARASITKPGTWIIGRGYDDARLSEQRHPTRYDLDAVSPEHPVLLIRACHHIAVANSLALSRAGISAHTPNPKSGIIDRDEHGEPTGVLRESAYAMVSRAIPAPTEEEIANAVVLGGQQFLSHGVTSVTEAGIELPEELRAYQQLRLSGRLPVRTYLIMIIDKTLDTMIRLGIQTGFGDNRLRIGPAKLFCDGSIGSRTARVRTPYLGQPDNFGVWTTPPDELKANVLKAHQAGFQVAIHAIGDAAISLVLDAYEEALKISPRTNARHRIEHCSIIDAEMLQRMARLGVVAVPGTSFLYAFRDSYLHNIGLDRLRYTYGMASYLRHGIVAAASTDAPVVSTSATIGLQTMMTRKSIDGNAVWPEEAVSLHDALRAYTANGAYASFEENIKGQLRPGMVGDVAIFETDLESVAADDIAQVQIDATILDGRVVYERRL